MEPQNNPEKKSVLPSKKFLVRGGIAIILVGGILLVQTNWFAHLFTKKPTAPLSQEKKVGEVLEKDSNNNTIPDWEERLWGLDPTVLTTNGIANKTIIEQKRALISPQTQEEQNALNDTDKIARDLFTFTTALGQEEGTNTDTIETLATKLATQGPQKNIAPVYTIKNIATVKTTIKSLATYKTKLAGTTKEYDATLPEIDIFIQSIENSDYSQVDTVTPAIQQYKKISKTLAGIPVPIGIAEYHLLLINSIAGISRGLEKMQGIEDNGINALVGLAEYRYFDAQLSTAVENITAYLEQYDIL